MDISRKYWNHFRIAAESHLDQFLLFSSPFLLISALMQVYILLFEPKFSDWTFFAIDSTAFFLFLLMVLYRKRIAFRFKLFVLNVVTLVIGVFSLSLYGITGTGFLSLALFIVLAFVFLNPKYATFLSVLSILILFILGYMFSKGILTPKYSPDTRVRLVSVWSFQAFALSGFSIIAGFLIHFMRSNLLKSIENLASSNQKLHDSNETIGKLAYYDRLTALPNSFRFESEVKDRIDGGISNAALVLLNLRGFRVINSILGREQGDQILKAVAWRLSALSIDGFVARISGDEFGIWMEADASQDLQTQLSRLEQSIRESFLEESSEYKIRFSIVVSYYPEDGRSFEDCFRKASLAIRYARKEGREDRILEYDEKFLVESEHQQRMRKAIEDAIESEEFEIAYQKQFKVLDGSLAGLECLSRWNSKEMGSVNPEVFIDVITRSNLMAPFGRMMFKKVLGQIPKVFEIIGKPVPVSMNVSPVVFVSPGFLRYIEETLKEFPEVDPNLIIFEITEDVFVEDAHQILDTVLSLKQIGIGISLDDFGKAYSSLSYFQQIPFSELKIDQSFVENICEDKKSFSLFQSICDLGKSFDLKIVAEGVEREEQMEKIRQTNCDVVQGFYYSVPEILV